MTGGQMAPTTLLGQKTTTSPYGRSVTNEGYPLRVSELISSLEAPVYVERVALTDPKNTNKVRRAVRKALQIQIENKGFSLIEVLSACPSGWKVSPVQAKEWIEDHLMKQFPLGVYRDRSQEVPVSEPRRMMYSISDMMQKLELPTDGVLEKEGMAAPAAAEKYQNPHLKMAGFGGQGILMLGLGVAQAGMQAGYHVSWLPSYGPEMRGGTANCHVNLSNKRIGSPMVTCPTVLVAMNLPSLDRFEDEVQTGGLIIYDSSLINHAPKRTDVEVLAIPATEIADGLGNTRVANMVVLGAYIALTKLMSKEVVFSALPVFIKRKNLISLNEQAIEKGMEFVFERQKVLA